jgi:alpha-tubulin suppressor-like RCC1 family protein
MSTIEINKPIIINSVGKIIIGNTPVPPVLKEFWVWGLNYGLFGNNTVAASLSPIQVALPGDYYKLPEFSSFYYNNDPNAFGCMALIDKNYNLFTWGYNGYGQLGDNTTINRSSPVQIAGSWNSITFGARHTLAIKTNGTLWSWGQNLEGELGNNTKINKSSPIQIGTESNWVKIAAGLRFSVAIKADGTLWVWGNDTFKKLGVGPTKSTISSPVQTAIGGNNWQSVSCSEDNTLAIKKDGTLWAWGDNQKGQLGINLNIDSGSTINSPVQVGTDTTWQKVYTEYTVSAAIKKDGTLWTWGLGTSGALGRNSTNDASSPIQVGIETNWYKISQSAETIFGLKTDGTLWAWGWNSNGELGDGTTTNKSSPVQTTLADNKWLDIIAALCGTFGVRSI